LFALVRALKEATHIAAGLVLFPLKEKGRMRKPRTHFEQVPLTALKAVIRTVPPEVVKLAAAPTIRKPARKPHR